MRLLAALALAAGLAAGLPAAADCTGRDMRGTLDAEERAELETAVANRPFAEGNHWIARRNDAVVHLVGTIHLADPRLAGPVEALRPVVEKAELLLLEMTPDDMDSLQSRLSRNPGMLVLENAALPDLMPEEDWQRLAAAAKARGIPPVLAAKFQPWYLTLMLAMPSCALTEAADANGLDSRLQEIAQEAGTPMAALEDIETVFRLFGSAPIEEQVDMLRASLLDPDEDGDMLATLMATYFEEKPAESWEITRLLARRSSPATAADLDKMYAEMEQTLLIGRNRAWLPVILDAADKGSPVVVAAGAAHLQGEDGLADLLEAEGFTLTRAPF